MQPVVIALWAVVCHAGFHFLGNVDDDGLVAEENSGFGSDTLMGRKRTRERGG